jgi:hypothetical protein
MTNWRLAAFGIVYFIGRLDWAGSHMRKCKPQYVPVAWPNDRNTKKKIFILKTELLASPHAFRALGMDKRHIRGTAAVRCIVMKNFSLQYQIMLHAT